MAAPIEDYAMLGDCRSAALVALDGSIDWLCLPRFDSATPFAALLGGPENGTWQIAPEQACKTSRAYRDGTMVLETRFRTAHGAATLIDFMPIDTPCPGVVRIVEGSEGEVSMLMNLVMRFDYGHVVPWVEHVDPQTLTAVAGPDMLVLRTEAPLAGVNQHTVSRFTVRAGQRVAFCLFQQASHLPVGGAIDAESALENTQAWWREFSGRCPVVEPYGDQVKRSLITMKALTYRPTGGIVAAVTSRDGVIYEAAFGRRAIDAPAAMTPDTIFRIASMTKALAAFAVMQLVGRGVLDLDAPAGDLVPYLREVRVLEGLTPAGQPILRAPRTPVTLRHLLTHTAGFAYNAWSAKQQRFTDATGYAPPGRDSFRTPLMFDPGTSWLYGVGYDWATRVLEAATGTRLATHMQDNVFGPLGMAAGWTVTGAARGRVARVHTRGPDGALVVDPADPPERVDHETGGGGLFTTASDYLRFIRLVLNGGMHDGERLIAESALAEMRNPAAASGNVVTGLVTTDPSRSNSGEFFPGLPKRHSLGFVVNERAAPTGRSAGGLCWAGFYNTYYWIDPARGIGGVFLTQIVPFLDTHALRVFGEFETTTYAALES